ncbi:MAG: HD domain-containing protein [Spirochaetes bacterium]|nr:HD domain-containing protein [Spirochaetota bacterium]
MKATATKRLFIVNREGREDDLGSRLETLGYRVIGFAGSVQEVMKDLQIHGVQMLIIDYCGEVDERLFEGVSTANSMMGIPSIVICSGDDDSCIECLSRIEPYGFITKPFTDSSLRACLEIASKRIDLEGYLTVSERKYRGIFEASKDPIFISDSHGSVIDYNEAMLELFGFEDDDMTDLSINDLYENMDQVVRIYEFLESHGYIKDLEVSLKRKDGNVIYGLLSTGYLQEGEHGVKFFQNILKEITPIKQRAFDEIQKSLLQLNDVMYGIIGAIGLAVEARDPFTAGHQRGVAKIAVEIAREMGLDPDTIEGVKIASLIHDLGKFSIPAEILSKPAKLTDVEYRIVKQHSVAGFNILQPINFPWPVAQIVRQHHERLDGSGYPDGLKQKEIMLEAKIVAVADVIESMTSHRPYRPSLGINKALEELVNGKGTLYEPKVVDVCLKLYPAYAESTVCEGAAAVSRWN